VLRSEDPGVIFFQHLVKRSNRFLEQKTLKNNKVIKTKIIKNKGRKTVKAIQSVAQLVLLSCAVLFSPWTLAADQAGLDAEIEELKTEVVELNRELFDLEEQLLYPATTSFAVFVSMDDVDDFDLNSVKLNLDQQDVTSHLYSKEQVAALKRGGIQKIYMGNLKPGVHKLTAEILGKDRDGRGVKKIVVADFGKARSSKYLEVKISHNPKQSKPDFAIVEWK